MDWSPRPEKQQQEAQAVADTKIQQKINRVHREAFVQKFPGQCEHVMRLIAERLQLGLRKDQPIELSNQEVADLAEALYHIYQIHTSLEGR